MTLIAAAQGLAWVAVAVTALIALTCLPDPRAGMRKLDHVVDYLPNVMLGRYLAFTGFSAFVAFRADLPTMTAWGVALAFMAFVDTMIYARVGKPFVKHLMAGGLALAISAVFVAAMISNGAA